MYVCDTSGVLIMVFMYLYVYNLCITPLHMHTLTWQTINKAIVCSYQEVIIYTYVAKSILQIDHLGLLYINIIPMHVYCKMST